MMSEAITSALAAGNTAATSSAIRSTPGPTAAKFCAAPQAGQVSGSAIPWPQWWQISRCKFLCSTSQAVQFGQAIRCPQCRHKVSGA
jgi:hypothetical protein